MATRNDSTPPAGQTIQAGTASPSRATNAVEAGRGRNRSSTDRRTTAAAETDSAQRKPENSIQPTKRRPKGTDAPSRPKQRREGARDADGQSAASKPGRGPGGQDASGAKAAPERKRFVPEHIAKRFVQVGKHYYFADGARAFTDRGGRLTTKSENTEVIRSLVAIAQARGWNEITVRGTERWIVEKRAFFEARAEAARTLLDTAVDPKRAVKRHPELVGTYLQVHAAELAAKQFRDREDQQRFVAQVRSALADAVARGEPLPPVRLRESAPERAAAASRGPRDREPARARE